MSEEKKKGFFGKALDALTSRDEKAAAEKAQQAAQASQDEAKAAISRARAEEAEKKAAEAEIKAKQLEEELAQKEKQEKARQLMEEMRARDTQAAAVAQAAAAAAAPKFMAEYEVKGWDETLSHVALKYYKNATRPYWEIIYEANKAVIGDNPNIIKPGMVLKIPELPENLKKK